MKASLMLHLSCHCSYSVLSMWEKAWEKWGWAQKHVNILSHIIRKWTGNMSKDDDIWTSFWAWLKYKSNTIHKLPSSSFASPSSCYKNSTKTANKRNWRNLWGRKWRWSCDVTFRNEIDSRSSEELNKMKKREIFLRNNIDINHGREWQSSWSKIFAWAIKKFIMCCHIPKIHSIGLLFHMRPDVEGCLVCSGEESRGGGKRFIK